MAHLRSSRFRKWAGLTAGILLGLLLLQVVFDPLPMIKDVANIIRIRWELPRARERWESHAPPSYQVHVKGALPMACFVDGELSVRQGQLVGVRMRANPLVPGSPLRDVDPSEWQRSLCPYEDLTVEGMFERVEADLGRLGGLAQPLDVRFDRELGFIADYRSGRASQGGILGGTVSECCTWFEFGDLTASNP
jgi:hypothetical protein